MSLYLGTINRGVYFVSTIEKLRIRDGADISVQNFPCYR